MTVSQMRRLLAAVRARLARQNELAPFSLVEEIAPGVVTWELCTRVAVGLHEKRTRSRTREKSASAGIGTSTTPSTTRKKTHKASYDSDKESNEDSESGSES
jgi:hypothetical protein